MYFWVTFKDRSAGTVEGDGPWYPEAEERAAMQGATSEEHQAAHKVRRDKALAEVRQRAAVLGEVESVEVLPYPADPRLDVRTDCPSFCWKPGECRGRTACPRRRSCDD